jgi:LCP family protein required for cell wall assembly
VLAALLVLILVANTLASCGSSPAAAAFSTAARPSHTPAVASVLAGPSPTLPPTLIPATALPSRVQITPTETATSAPSPTGTDTPTITPSPTLPPPGTQTSTPAPSPSPVPTTALAEEVVTVLLIGGDGDYVLDMNTDTLIVAVINRATKQVSLLSIPRDLWVNIPTYGWGRINIAHRIGQRGKYPEGRGPGLLMRTIEENLGIPIDHWVRIGYEGFARAVDELGGVDMVVACQVNLRYRPPSSKAEQEMILPPGVYHLDGATALRYVRTRRGDTDFERAQRQQQFLKAVWYQFKSPETVLKIPELWTAMKGAFATDLQLGDVLALAPVALELEPQRVHSLSIGRGQVQSWTTAEGAKVLLPIPERVQEVVARLYAPPLTDDTAAGEAASIQVRNGTGRAQLDLIAADRLRWEGFTIVDTGLADRIDYLSTQIIVFNDKPEALAALTRLLKVKPANVIRQPDASQSGDLLVILGKDYDPCQ